MKKKRVETIFLTITAIVIYFVLPYLQEPFLKLCQVNIETMPDIFKYVFLFSWQIMSACTIFLLFHEYLEKGFKDLKKNHKKYFRKYFKYWFLILGVMMISNAFINIISGKVAGNEEAIRSLFEISPVYVFVVSVIFAPFVEELIFRQGIRNLIKNDTLFIIVSGLVFGGLHVVGNVSSPIDLFYLIPYCTPGFVFAYLLTKTNNVLVPASLHFIHNGILMSLQFFILIFG